MYIPKFWARSTRKVEGGGGAAPAVSCWQWSDVSTADAQRQAEAKVAQLAEKLLRGDVLDRYLYGDRPMREEIVRRVGGGGTGAELGVVTRNLYGALVLNASSAMFIDVDFASQGGQAAKQGGILGRLFGKSSAGDVEQRAVEHVRAWAGQQPGLGMRVYRTFAGLRCLVTSRTYDPASSETMELLRGAGSDPLYIRLCMAQACFRARLTPKPWRCGARTPPTRYPWLSSEQEARFRKWQAGYERSTAAYSVCRLIQQIGPSGVHPAIGPIVALHDQFTLGQTTRPLA